MDHPLDKLVDALSLHFVILKSNIVGQPSGNFDLASQDLKNATKRLHHSATKLTILFGDCGDPDLHNEAVDSMEQSSAALVQATHNFIIESLSGDTLKATLIHSCSKVIRSVNSLIKALRSNEKIAPTMTGAVWDVLKELSDPPTNKIAIKNKLNMLIPILKDGYNELEETLNQEDPGSESDSFEDEFKTEIKFSEDSVLRFWKKIPLCQFSFMFIWEKKLVPACIELEKICHVVVSQFVLKLLTEETEPLDPNQVQRYETFLVKSTNLLSSVESLTENVYPPQDLKAVSNLFQDIKDQLDGIISFIKEGELKQPTEQLLPHVETKIKAVQLP